MKVEIPESLAKELSDLLLKKGINIEVLAHVYNDQAAYDKINSETMDIQRRIDAIKVEITNTCIPEEFNSDQYQWFFNYAIDGNKIEIRKV